MNWEAFFAWVCFVVTAVAYVVAILKANQPCRMAQGLGEVMDQICQMSTANTKLSHNWKYMNQHQRDEALKIWWQGKKTLLEACEEILGD